MSPRQTYYSFEETLAILGAKSQMDLCESRFSSHRGSYNYEHISEMYCFWLQMCSISAARDRQSGGVRVYTITGQSNQFHCQHFAAERQCSAKVYQ